MGERGRTRTLGIVLAALAALVVVGGAVVLLGTQGPAADEGTDPRDPSDPSTTPPPALGSSGEVAVAPRAGGAGLGQVRSPEVCGRVLTAAEIPVPGAAVVLARASAADGEVVGRTTADRRGEFTFADVPTGEPLVVSATAPGLDPARTTIDEVRRGGRPHVTLRFPLRSGVRGRVRVERPFTARVFLQQGPMVQDVATVSDTAPAFDRPGFRPGPGILLIAAEIPELAEVRFAAIRVVVPDDARVDVGDVTPDGGEVMTVVLLPERPAPPGTRADVMATFFLREGDPPENCLFQTSMELGRPTVFRGLPDAAAQWSATVSWDGNPSTPKYRRAHWHWTPATVNFLREVALAVDRRPPPPDHARLALRASPPPGVSADATRVLFVAVRGEATLLGGIPTAVHPSSTLARSLAVSAGGDPTRIFALANGHIAGPRQFDEVPKDAALEAQFDDWRPATTLRVLALDRDGKPAARATVWVARPSPAGVDAEVSPYCSTTADPAGRRDVTVFPGEACRLTGFLDGARGPATPVLVDASQTVPGGVVDVTLRFP